MSAQHTPGPWVTNGLVVSARVFPKQCAVCELSTSAPSGGGTYRHDLHFPTLQANARLIAAAPELLEALEAAVMDLEYAVALAGRANELRANAISIRLATVRAAIAKAAGEQA